MEAAVLAGSPPRPLCPPAGTWKRVPGEAQLTNDVTRNVCLDKVTLLGVALGCLQQVVELLRVEFLSQSRVKLRVGSEGQTPPCPIPLAPHPHPTPSPGTPAALQGAR